jgi:DNA repair exonuclease SbcCD ATPase subunit
MTADCPEPQNVVVTDPAVEQRHAAEIEQLQTALDEASEQLADQQAQTQALEVRIDELSQERDGVQLELEDRERALASLEERYATLEIELQSAVEEVLRSMARVRTVKTRALAVSRIAEVRVQLEAVPGTDDEEVATRLRRARDFLTRADAVLEEGNYGGASFLAERANDIIREARLAHDIRVSSNGNTEGVIPIIPPRPMEVLENSNLREGPGIDTRRVGRAPRGTEVIAVARSDSWYQVETPSGLKAWISGDLVR